jgi:peptidoglycan/LPS O-acetylase OafA/YrhL
LSGFLITGILYDAREERHYFRNFYVRRSLRIWPLYYGVLAAVLLLLPLLSSGLAAGFSAARDHQGWLWLYGANIYNSWQGGWMLGKFDHFWSLAVEEHFYLVWPLVIFFASRKTSLRVCAALMILTPLARIGWLACGGNSTAAESFTLFRVDALAAGAWVALVIRTESGRRLLERWSGPVLAVTTLVLLPMAITGKRVLYLPETLYAVFFGAVLVYAVTLPDRHWISKFWKGRSLRFLGKYSYAMYVFQNLLIPIAAIWFTSETLSKSCGSRLVGEFCYVAIMFAATLVVALASWHLFEKHFLSLKKHFEGERA